MKQTTQFFAVISLSLLLFVTASLSGCNSSGNRTSEKIPEQSDTTVIALSLSETDSITIIYGDEQTLYAKFSDKDARELEKLLHTASYDTHWNQSGIMVKMVVPDYTVIFHYKGQPQDNNDWLMLWKESGRTKFRNTWYVLSPDHRELVYRILEDQRD